MTAVPAIHESAPFDALEVAAYLDSRYGDGSPEKVIEGALKHLGDRFAIVSSFGSRSAVLLHLASKVSKDIPVLFLDTGKLFGETKRFRDDLSVELGLTDVRTIHPDPNKIGKHDPKGHLWTENTNKCCFYRKVAPLEDALQGFDGWASGRKRFQGGVRSLLSQFEAGDGRVKVNPLALWIKDDVSAYIDANNLPRHPLVAEGYASIGCMPCTQPIKTGENERAGRWRGQSKTECGIHLSLAENSRIISDTPAATVSKIK